MFVGDCPTRRRLLLGPVLPRTAAGHLVDGLGSPGGIVVKAAGRRERGVAVSLVREAAVVAAGVRTWPG